MITTTENGIERGFSCERANIRGDKSSIKDASFRVQMYTIKDGAMDEKIGAPINFSASPEILEKYGQVIANIFEDALSEERTPKGEVLEVPES